MDASLDVIELVNLLVKDKDDVTWKITHLCIRYLDDTCFLLDLVPIGID
jgi:hypothetical protein